MTVVAGALALMSQVEMSKGKGSGRGYSGNVYT